MPFHVAKGHDGGVGGNPLTEKRFEDFTIQIEIEITVQRRTRSGSVWNERIGN